MSEDNNKNVGSIEEAIKRCNELIKVKHSQWIGITNQNAIKTVLDNLEALCDMQRSADKKIKELDKTNNDLRLLYRRTANKLSENGKDELARYFLAQINEVPTFTVDEDIDYYEEYYKLKEKVKELEETISEAIYYVWSDENKDKQGWWTEALLNILQETKKTFYYSIPRKNIEDKIEELSNIKGDFATYIAVSERISALQELLQESEDK